MTRPLKILVVDDDRVSRHSTSLQLNNNGELAQPVDGSVAALKLLQQEAWDVVLTDMRMPVMSGIEFLRRIKESDINVDVIVMTAFATVETAVEAMMAGAVDYLGKPFKFEELALRLAKIRELRETQDELRSMHEILEGMSGRNGLFGSSPGMDRVHERIEIFAEHDAPVLITGETGTGKELVARAIHAKSTRASGPFVPLACGAIPPELAESELFGHEKGAYTGAHGRATGIFERAHNGSVLLDDVDDLPLNMQVKLLRVLQEGTLVRVGGNEEIVVDTRIIATTKVDLDGRVADNRFRDDLYYRLRGLEIELPPLRERGDDALILSQHFLDRIARRDGTPTGTITPDAAQMVRSYAWPGNVRELRRTIESAYVLSRGEPITPEHFHSSVRTHRSVGAPRSPFKLDLDEYQSIDFQAVIEDFEQALIMWALAQSDGRQSGAAEILGLPRTTFQSKLGRKTNA